MVDAGAIADVPLPLVGGQQGQARVEAREVDAIGHFPVRLEIHAQLIVDGLADGQGIGEGALLVGDVIAKIVAEGPILPHIVTDAQLVDHAGGRPIEVRISCRQDGMAEVSDFSSAAFALPELNLGAQFDIAGSFRNLVLPSPGNIRDAVQLVDHPQLELLMQAHAEQGIRDGQFPHRAAKGGRPRAGESALPLEGPRRDNR